MFSGRRGDGGYDRVAIGDSGPEIEASFLPSQQDMVDAAQRTPRSIDSRTATRMRRDSSRSSIFEDSGEETLHEVMNLTAAFTRTEMFIAAFALLVFIGITGTHLST